MNRRIFTGESIDDKTCEPFLRLASSSFFIFFTWCPIHGCRDVYSKLAVGLVRLQEWDQFFVDCNLLESLFKTLHHLMVQRVPISFRSACSVQHSSSSALLIVHFQATQISIVHNLLGLWPEVKESGFYCTEVICVRKGADFQAVLLQGLEPISSSSLVKPTHEWFYEDEGKAEVRACLLRKCHAFLTGPFSPQGSRKIVSAS